MTDKDPFAEPDDTERTVIRPNPGGRRKAAPVNDQKAVKSQSIDKNTSDNNIYREPEISRASNIAADILNQGKAGMNKLNASASNLFSLISRIRNQSQHSNPDNLRKAVVSEIQKFENNSLETGVDKKEIRVARYVICATIDDVILNTPWGGNSSWGMQSMVGTFHKETVGGDRFYDLLNKLQEDPLKNINLLEFIYMCLSLGFEGRLRIEKGGKDKHTQIRYQLSIVIRRQRGDVSSELSPKFEGMDKPYASISIWKPFWLASSVVLALLTVSFLILTFILSGKTERFVGEMSFANSSKVAVLLRKADPPPPPPTIKDDHLEKIKTLLQKDIGSGGVEVLGDSTTITLRLAGAKMFTSGSEQIERTSISMITRLAAALKETSGPILVIGHSDNVPIKSTRFSSNRQLSLARAESVMNYIGFVLSQDRRMTAEGHAEKEPIASNSTSEGRATNRRIEIVILRSN